MKRPPDKSHLQRRLILVPPLANRLPIGATLLHTLPFVISHGSQNESIIEFIIEEESSEIKQGHDPAKFVVTLDLILGYAGIVSLGHAAFFGVGAYAAGLLAVHGWGEPVTGLVVAGEPNKTGG
jgi:hypothetical protein